MISFRASRADGRMTIWPILKHLNLECLGRQCSDILIRYSERTVLRYSEKATKLFFGKSGRFFPNFVAFSQYLNFTSKWYLVNSELHISTLTFKRNEQLLTSMAEGSRYVFQIAMARCRPFQKVLLVAFCLYTIYCD